jgi:hypothetical protein
MRTYLAPAAQTATGVGMDRPNWNSRVQEIERAIADLRKAAPDDPARERQVRDLAKRVRKLLDEEDAPGQPLWVSQHRHRLQLIEEHRRIAAPVVAEIREAIDQETGTSWGDNLHVGCSLGFTSIRFDVWYDTDAELEHDRATGRHAELAKIIKEIAERITAAPATVYFHSHQFVREKCGGNYFNYMR